ncbi:heavy-metal-associated domain-containing protein [Falsarthrobacter nasiphocae]|uniref:Copper chaperone CopZ n=1 Tax=Falsarthrobacter nasiphocae TaxID=189863 RepID=A0AAE3YH78_9MICC|nr:heavy-metal-associated domain-containing protein [Falsarthrobacter nasiphocae]MDR6892145.1 copper chaperone CopZ [Falsarthrobacter nasiphocae]
MSNTTTVLVEGMTCGHCATAVTEELTSIEAVTDVAVELAEDGPSRVTVTSSAPVSPAEISEAVAEAGYSVVGEA